MFKFSEIKDTLSKNGPGIATALSMVLTGLSVYFAIKKAPEGALAKIQYEKAKADVENKPLADQNKNDEISVKAAYGVALAKTYKESLACAAGAVTCAYLSNKWNGKTITALGAALAINEDKLKKVYKNAEKVFGKGGKDDLKEMTDCDIPFEPDKKVEKGKQSFKHRKEPVEKFYESYTGTMFESTGGDVNGAIDRAYEIMKRDPKHMLNFNKFLSLLGLPDVPAGTNVGFRTGYCDLSVSTKLVMINGEEVVGIFYDEDPCSGYDSKRIY